MDFLQSALTWYTDHLGYLAVFLLMAMESTFLPLPSEVIIPPAAWLAAKGDLNVLLVVLMAVLGSVAGALINYCLGYFLGRPVIHALSRTGLAKLLHVGEPQLDRAELWFVRNGQLATFLGRLVPGVRHLISIPAGMSRMPLLPFVACTAGGALVWVSVLAALGAFLYTQKDVLEQSFHVLVWIGMGLGLAFVAWLVVRGLRRRSARKAQDQPPSGEPGPD